MTAWDDYLKQGIEGLVLKSGSSCYPSVGAALSALDWLEAHNCVVLGFEGFSTDGHTLRPRLDRIADFSEELPAPWRDRVRKSIAASRTILAQWDDVQFVDLVVDEPADSGPCG